ncbi:MAG: hypothetical protein ABI554_06470 [Flavobacterium sp.]
MSKNSIHNFDLSIKNSTDIKSSEDLTKVIIKELAKVSKEMGGQKDIVQIWQEQKNQNAVLAENNFNSFSGEGATNTTDTTIKLISNTSSDSEEKTTNYNNLTSSTLIEGGVTDNSGRTTTGSSASENNTPSKYGVENNTLNFGNGVITRTYENVAGQQTIKVPQMLKPNTTEPTVEAIKSAVKKKLDVAIIENDAVEITYWTSVLKAFEEGATAQDFDGKPDNILFTQMYATLKQPNPAVENQNFNWEIVRKKMIESIDANILIGQISSGNKQRWEKIKKQLNDDAVNIANLFEQYDELFLLLKELQGLDTLPNTITITTKTKIYPNLRAIYAEIGKENVYVFLKNRNDTRGSAVDKYAVKIKNTAAKSFIVGESLDFFLDEKFVNESLYKKENINWIVYNVENKKETIFIDKGASLSYNFDKAGVYRIDAFGHKPTIKGSKSAISSTFIELAIIAQKIVITSPFKDNITRASVKEQLFKVALKNTKVKTLNPIKLYYQIETKTTNKAIKISEEQELDASGIIKLAMPDLDEYKIKVNSKDQYALTQESVISVIKNEVTSIGQAEKTSNNGIFLLGDKNSTLTLETKTFKINPATNEEKEDVKWMIYDANNKPYLSPGSVIMTKNKDPKKTYLHQWGSYDVPIPQKVGHYSVEAYSDIQKGSKAKSVFKIEVQQPQIKEAYWAFSGGSKKQESGISGESNWIKAIIPYYNHQTIRMYFYLDKKKTNHYCDVKTNENGEIFKEIKFDSDFKKLIGFANEKKTKIGFKLLGIQNGKPCPFKIPANYESDTVLSVTTDVKILDAYFMYDGNRVTAEDQIPFDKKGTIVTIIAKTQNMVGKNIILTAHKVGENPAFRHEVKVNSEGVATINFTITPAKGLKNGTINKYYVGIEGYSTKHLSDKMVNMVVGGKRKDTVKLNSDALEMIWGGKVSIEFRQKVVQICEELWGKDQKYEMANALMIAMSVETGETFSSSLIRSTKNGYVGVSKEEHKNNPNLVHNNPIGLAQFTEDAVKSLILKEKGILENKETAKAITKKEIDDYKQKLALLSPEDQLSYVRDYLKLFNIHKKVTRPEDVYMIIFAPRATGQGDNVDIYKKYLTEQDKANEKINIKYIKNAAMDTRNDGFNRGNNDGVIQSGELLARYREMKAKGLRYTIDINETRKLNQVLAEKIIKGGRVSFANSHVSGVLDKAMAKDNINDTSIGENAKRSYYKRAPGGEIEVVSELLFIMYQLSKDYTFNVSEISGADHSRTSRHYLGKAFDVSEINGLDIGQGIGAEAVANPKVSNQLINDFSSKALSYGALLVWNKLNDKVKKEHHNHFHVEVK